MVAVSAVRAGLVARLRTISGLEAYDYVPDAVNPPAAFVTPGVLGSEALSNAPIDYSQTYRDGSHDLTFTVRVLVSQMHNESGQSALDEYLDSAGSKSILAAVEGDETLGGAADYAVVPMCTFYGKVTHNNVDFFGAEFMVKVTAR